MAKWIVFGLLILFLVFNIDVAHATILNISASRDSWISEASPTTNYGTDGNVLIETNASSQKRPMVHFNIGSIPAGATINSASVYLYAYSYDGSQGAVSTLYDLASDWAETSVTWNNAPALSTFTSESTNLTAINTWYSWDVTNVARQWYNGTKSNYGLQMRSSSGGTYYIASRENVTTAIRPYLSVNYTITTGAGTAIHGIVYLTGTAKTPLSGATVFIYNTTWSNTQVVDSSGYYIFSGLKGGEAYYLKATLKDYEDSNLQVVSAVTDTWITQDIPLEKCVSGFNCFYNQHYAKFIVQNFFGTKYEGVTVTVYKDSDVVYSATTKTDGSVTFLLTKDQVYTVTAVKASAGISMSVTVIPSEPIYYIVTSATAQPWWTNVSYSEVEQVKVSVSTSTINTTHAFVNTSYRDYLNQTSGLIFYLNQTNASDTATQIMRQSYNGGTNNYSNASFIVSDYGGQSYLINVKATHSTFGSILRSFGVRFRGLPSTAADFLGSEVKAIISVGFLVFVAAFFGATSKVQGAGIVCITGWILYGFGWLDGLGGNYALGTPIGLTLATIVAVLANMAERSQAEGVS